jgi:hypothetical protein
LGKIKKPPKKQALRALARRSERLWGERVLPGLIEALNPRRVASKGRYVWIFVHTEGNSTDAGKEHMKKEG